MPRTCHAMTMPSWKWLLKATAQHSMGMAWHMWISIGRPETARGRSARVWLLPATMWRSTKVIRSIPIHQTVGLAVRIFPAAMKTFMKNTALSENDGGAARHVWIGLKVHSTNSYEKILVLYLSKYSMSHYFICSKILELWLSDHGKKNPEFTTTNLNSPHHTLNQNSITQHNQAKANKLNKIRRHSEIIWFLWIWSYHDQK
jgi:hypothetical protein